MNTNIDNFINSEAVSIETIKAQIAAAEAEEKELKAKLKAIKGEKPTKERVS